MDEVELKAEELSTKQQLVKVLVSTAVGFVATKLAESVIISLLERRNATAETQQ